MQKNPDDTTQLIFFKNWYFYLEHAETSFVRFQLNNITKLETKTSDLFWTFTEKTVQNHTVNLTKKKRRRIWKLYIVFTLSIMQEIILVRKLHKRALKIIQTGLVSCSIGFAVHVCV